MTWSMKKAKAIKERLRNSVSKKEKKKKFEIEFVFDRCDDLENSVDHAKTADVAKNESKNCQKDTNKKIIFRF